MSMKRFRRAFLTWAYGFVGGCIGAGISSLASGLGLNGAHAAGTDVPAMNWKGIGIMFLIGVITHGALFMKQSPLPPLQFDDTVIIPNPNNKKEDEKTPINP